jgi:L-ascorbate metabolism protein UlaG (beta-lactamase superfamily)
MVALTGRKGDVVSNDKVKNYSRPVSLGGANSLDSDEVSIRWFGTACFEIAFGDKVILLDNYYDRPAYNRDLGFGVEDVEKADLLLIGHPHHDHVGDTVRVSQQTGARAVIAPIGAEFLLEHGLKSDKVVSASGLGDGQVLNEDGYSVQVLHGFHLDIAITDEDAKTWGEFREVRSKLENSLLHRHVTPEQTAEARETAARGVHTPEVNTEGTLTYVIDIDGFKIAFRDSGGAISDEEAKYFGNIPGVDLAILSINGLPHVAQHLEEVFLPLARLYKPRVLVPSHHDQLWTAFGDQGLAKIFDDVATEPIKSRIHEELPETITTQPALIEPLTVNRKTGEVRLGELSRELNLV